MENADDAHRQHLEQVERQIHALEAELDALRMIRRQLEIESALRELFANTSGFVDQL